MKHAVSIGFLTMSLIITCTARAEMPGLKTYEAFFKAHPPQKIAAPTDLNAIALSTAGSASSLIWETDGRWARRSEVGACPRQ